MTCADLHDSAPHPQCLCCRQTDQVSPVPLVRLEPTVEYWRCDRCGYIWESREGEPAA